MRAPASHSTGHSGAPPDTHRSLSCVRNVAMGPGMYSSNAQGTKVSKTHRVHRVPDTGGVPA